MPDVSYRLSACLVCGGTRHRELADADALRAEVEALWRFHTRRLLPATPPERLADRLAFSQRPPLRLARCEECGLVFRNPAERPDLVTAAYEDEAPSMEVLRALHDTQRSAYRAQARRLTRVHGRPGRVLEVGSYVGGFLAAAGALGWRAQGVDVNASANRLARERGLVVHDGELSAIAADDAMDAVAIWNCLDQLADPRATLVQARERLRPGGTLALRVPNGAFYAALRPWLDSSAPGRAPAARALLAHNNLLGFPYRYGFTPDALTRLVQALGLRVVHLHGDVLVPVGDRWTRGWARAEEALLKRAMRAVYGAAARRGTGAAGARMAPWFELYASRQ